MGPTPIEMGPTPIEMGPTPIEASEPRSRVGEASDEPKNPKMSKNAKRKSMNPPTPQPDRCALLLPFTY